MAAGSADQPAPDGAARDERYGILTLARMRKDDGRSLILYSHDDDGRDTGEARDSAPPREDEDGREAGRAPEQAPGGDGNGGGERA
ncbi:MAG TPA: hypothetical protein VGI27_01385 [Solirubrobacteraceae bacterium]|jgi:hypothetical protein